MDVQCEKCGTEYALDETLVGPSGTAVRCTSCGHVFKVFATDKPAGGRETWMLRQASGATFPFDRLGVLQDWISAGKVSEDDLIAKSGGEWKRLGDIAEMQPFFDALKPTQQSMPSSSAPAAGYQSTTPSELDKTIRAPAGGIAPSAPPQPGGSGPSTAEYGTARPDAFAATQVGTPMAQPVSTLQPGAPTVQANAPTLQAHSPSIDPQTAATQPQMPVVQAGAPTVQAQLPPGVGPAPGHPYDPNAAATQPQMPAAQPRAQAGTEMAPTRPLKPVPDSVQPAHVAATAPTAEAATVALSADDPRYAKAVSQPPGPAAAPRTMMSEPNFSESQIPAAKDEGRWERGAGVQAEGPAWAERGAARPDEDDDYGDELPERKSSPGKWIALVIIVLLVGGGFYMFMFQRQIVDDLLAKVIESGDTERHEKFFLSGQEQFLLDTFPAFKQADREYQKVLALSENDAPTLAALAEMYAVWAQYLRDNALDARTDALADAGEGEAPDLREVERLEAEFAEKLAEAKRWAEQAIETDPELAATHQAMADVKRLSGDLDGARNEMERTRGADVGAATDYVKAMVAIDEGDEAANSAQALDKVVKLEELLRALYRQGRALAAADDTGGAKKSLARLTELNSQHGLARDLSERIGAGKRVFLTQAALDSHFSDLDAGAEAPDAGLDTDSATVPTEAPPTKVAAPTGGGGGGGFVPTGGSPDALLARAAKLQQSGNSSGAATLFQKVLESQPSNIDALCGLAYCYLDRGNKGQAIAHFRRALGVNGSYGPAIIGLANTYKSQGNKSEALKWYKKYLQVRPGGRHANLAKTNIERLEGELGKGGGEAATDTGGDKPASDTGADKPTGDSTEKPSSPPASDPPSGGSTSPTPPPASDDPHSLPAPKEQPPATEG